MKKLLWIPLLSLAAAITIVLLITKPWEQERVYEPPFLYTGTSYRGSHYEKDSGLSESVSNGVWSFEYYLDHHDGSPITVKFWQGREDYSDTGLVGVLNLKWIDYDVHDQYDNPYDVGDIVSITYYVDWHRVDAVTQTGYYDKQSGYLLWDDGEIIRDRFEYVNYDLAGNTTIDASIYIELADGRKIREYSHLKMK